MRVFSRCVRLAGMPLILAAIVVFPSISLAEKPFEDMTYSEMVDRVERIRQSVAVPSTYPVMIVESDDINAWTIGSGMIFITGGILRACESDDEVAGILCHEYGHHSLKHFEKAQKRQEVFERVLDMYSAQASKYPEYYEGGVLKKTTKVTAMIARVRFGHQDEYEADRAAYRQLLHSGCDPLALSKLFRRLSQKFIDSKPLSFLTDHPSFSSRIERFEWFDKEHLSAQVFSSNCFRLIPNAYWTAIESGNSDRLNHFKVSERFGVTLYLLWPKEGGLVSSKGSLTISKADWPQGYIILLSSDYERSLLRMGVKSGSASVIADYLELGRNAIRINLAGLSLGQQEIEIIGTYLDFPKKGKPRTIQESIKIKVIWPKEKLEPIDSKTAVSIPADVGEETLKIIDPLQIL